MKSKHKELLLKVSNIADTSLMAVAMVCLWVGRPEISSVALSMVAVSKVVKIDHKLSNDK